MSYFLTEYIAKDHTRDWPKTLDVTLSDHNIVFGDGTKVGRVEGIDDNALADAGCLQARRAATRVDDVASLANEEGILEDDMVV